MSPMMPATKLSRRVAHRLVGLRRLVREPVLSRVLGAATAVLLLPAPGCGPHTSSTGGAGDAEGTGHSVDDSPPTSDGPGASDSGDGEADSGGSGVVEPCPEGEYCFEIVDIATDKDPRQPAAGDVDGDGRAEVGFSTRAGRSSPYLSENWIVDWLDGAAVVLGPTGDVTGSPQFVAPSPIDGTVQFFATDGATTLVDGELVAREYPRPDFVGLPGRPEAVLGPLDIDGDGRHDLLAFEDETEGDFALTGHAVRFEGDVPTVVAPPLPTHIANGHPYGVAFMAAHDFDGDGRDEIVALDDTVIAAINGDDYDPRNNQVVTLRVTENGFEELWRAPAGILGVEVRLADLDGDGVEDLIIGGEYGVAIAAGGGGGTFDAPAPLDPTAYEIGVPGDGYRYVAAAAPADLDGDGLNELVVAAGVGGGDLAVVQSPLATPSRVVLAEAILESSNYLSGARAIAVGDVDGNGCDDLAFVAAGDEPRPLRLLMFHR